jgi:hypothetical protein
MNENDDAWNALIDAFNAFFTDHDMPYQFLTIYGPINGKFITTILNNIAIAYGVTESNFYETQASKELPHFFTFASRYDGEIFQGIMPDTGAAGIFTAGELQALALKKRFPESTIDTFTAGRYKVKFGNNHEISFLGTIGVKTFFGTIHFEVMPTNTPFLFCFANMDRHNVYFNNINNTLVHNGKKYPVVRKWEHPWLLLDEQKSTIIYCHLTETELRQLHRRFGHPAADRLYKVLNRVGYDNIDETIIAKINKYCH